MGRVILIVLILAVLFIAFKYFKVNISNSALRNEEDKYLADASNNEPFDGDDTGDESGDAVDSFDPDKNDAENNN